MPYWPTWGICGLSSTCRVDPADDQADKPETVSLVQRQRVEVVVGRHQPHHGGTGAARLLDHALEELPADAPAAVVGQHPQTDQLCALAGLPRGHADHSSVRPGREPGHGEHVDPLAQPNLLTTTESFIDHQSGRAKVTRRERPDFRDGGHEHSPSYRLRSLRIRWLANLPGEPITQPPGWVPDPHW